MSEPLPKNWLIRKREYKLIALANEIDTHAHVYIMEDVVTGMNVSIPFYHKDLKIKYD